jgi:hypothetical protein
MKRILAYSTLLFGLALAPPLLAASANGKSGSITVLNANVSSGTATTGSSVAVETYLSAGQNMYTGSEARTNVVAIQVTGTFTATLTFQASYDLGSTWVSFPVVVAPIPTTNITGTGVTTTTGTGKWYANTAGATNFRVTCTAYTSGTATVVLEKSTGSQLVTIQGMPTITTAGGAADGAAVSGNPTLIAGQDGTLAQSLKTDSTGRLEVIGGAADDAAIAGNPVPVGVKAIADAAQPSAVTAGDVAYAVSTLERIPIVTTRHPNAFNCRVATSTATTLTAVGGSCAAPGAGLSLYISDISFASSVDGDVTTADAYMTIKSGTGGTCGSGTAVLWGLGSLAKTSVAQQFRQPIKVAANSEICWIHSVAGSKTLNVQGYIAP